MSSSGGSGSDASTHRSGRSPNPRRNTKSLLKPLLSLPKNDRNAKSPPTSNGSEEDSEESTPTPSSTTNGSNNNEATDVLKSAKPGGRLKFFKDGVLCLELSHHDEGEKTKWVQIRTKTVFPTIVHASKEASIPCHLTPSAFSSPSVTQNSRLESSTSHSMSDDGSSMLSSPRCRESTWKQSVPQRRLSSCHEFFMKPARCVFKCRRKMHIKAMLKLRRPYFLPATNGISVTCSCGESDPKGLQVPNGVVKDDDISETDAQGEVVTNNANKCKKKKCNLSLENLIKKLGSIAESRSPVLKINTVQTKLRASLLKTPLVTPKKRILKDVETRDPNFRPKKKSPSNFEKTILTIPEFYRRQTSAAGNDLSPSPYLDNTGESITEAINLCKPHNKNRNRPSNNSTTVGSGSKSSRSSPYLGAKSISTSKFMLNTSELANHSSNVDPNQTVKSAIKMSESGGGSTSVSPTSKNKTSVQQQRKEQNLFQQQTMSKTISYTINSLLGTGHNESSSHSKLLSSVRNGSTKSFSQAKNSNVKSQTPSKKAKTNYKIVNNTQGSCAGKEESFGTLENDQNSFLRHLLDTSDPIPSGKTERNTIIHSKSSKNSSSSKSNNSNSNANTNNPTPASLKTTTSTKSTSKPFANSSSSSSNNHSIRNSSQASQAHTLSSAITDASPYSSLFRPPDGTAALAAAAAAFHYGSLLPAAFLPHLSTSTAAAAAAASYLVPHSSAATTTSSAVPQFHYGNNNAINLSQPLWPGFLPGAAFNPSFHGYIGEDIRNLSAIQSRASNSFHGVHTVDRDEGFDSPSVDNDVPLNLSKK